MKTTEDQNNICELIDQICETYHNDDEILRALSRDENDEELKKILAEDKMIETFSKELLSKGRKVVYPILTKLASLEVNKKNATNPWSDFYLIRVLSNIAEPQDAQVLANLLLRYRITPDEVNREGKHAIRFWLVTTLEKIGDASVVPILEEYVKATEKVQPLNQLEQEIVNKAIATCKARPAPTTTTTI